MEHERFDAYRQTVAIDAGNISYADVGSGAAALFVHGIFTSSHLWRHVVEGLSDVRRCIALDLPAHGRTQVAGGRDLTLPALAELLEDFCQALGLQGVDLVANDTGGAIAQIFAVRHPERLRTLTLTNCDVHDQLPPEAFKGAVELAHRGEMAPTLVQMYNDPRLVRDWFAQAYERPEKIGERTVREYLRPCATLAGAREVERAVTSLQTSDLTAIEAQLREFDVPTLIVWGTDDVFFDVRWAYWLEQRVPGVEQVVEVPGGKLFFPDERPEALVSHLRAHWEAHAPADAAA